MQAESRRAAPEVVVSKECVFCEICAGEEPASIVYRDAGFLAFMSNVPVNPGHLLIVPEVHTPSLGELEPRLASHIVVVAQQLAAALRESRLRCEAINLFLADGHAASQLVPHLHLHVVPRFTGDRFKLNARGGVTTWEKTPSRAELDGAAEAIRMALAAHTGG